MAPWTIARSSGDIGGTCPRPGGVAVAGPWMTLIAFSFQTRTMFDGSAAVTTPTPAGPTADAATINGAANPTSARRSRDARVVDMTSSFPLAGDAMRPCSRAPATDTDSGRRRNVPDSAQRTSGRSRFNTYESADDEKVQRARAHPRTVTRDSPESGYKSLPMIRITRSLPSRSGYVSPRSMKPMRVYSRIAGSFVEVTPRPIRA